MKYQLNLIINTSTSVCKFDKHRKSKIHLGNLLLVEDQCLFFLLQLRSCCVAWSILFSLFLGCDILNVVKLKEFVAIYVPTYHFSLPPPLGNCPCLCPGHLWVHHSSHLMFSTGLEKLNYRKHMMNI